MAYLGGIFFAKLGGGGGQNYFHMKRNASPGEQSEAPRRRGKPGQERHPGPQNQDSQHMLNQHRGSFPEKLIFMFRVI